MSFWLRLALVPGAFLLAAVCAYGAAFSFWLAAHPLYPDSVWAASGAAFAVAFVAALSCAIWDALTILSNLR